MKLCGLGAAPAVFVNLPRRAYCLSQTLSAPSPTIQSERESPTEEPLPKPSSDAHSGLPAKQSTVAAGPTALPFSSPTHFPPWLPPPTSRLDLGNCQSKQRCLREKKKKRKNKKGENKSLHDFLHFGIHTAKLSECQPDSCSFSKHTTTRSPSLSGIKSRPTDWLHSQCVVQKTNPFGGQSPHLFFASSFGFLTYCFL